MKKSTPWIFLAIALLMAHINFWAWSYVWVEIDFAQSDWRFIPMIFETVCAALTNLAAVIVTLYCFSKAYKWMMPWE